MEINTGRYKIVLDELQKGGPGGYESTYLTSEGDPASQKLYELISKLEGKFLPVENKAARGRNLEILEESLTNKKNLGIVSGFKPSGPFHFGHKLASGAVAFFQRNGVQAFIPVADLECWMSPKISVEEYEYWAADNLIDWGANGVDLDAAHVYLQSEEFRVSVLAYLLARGLEFGLPLNIYGAQKMIDEFQFLFAGVTQVGDIVLPQHNDFGNHHSFMVSGQDQDGHMKLTTSLVQKAKDQKIRLPGVSTTPSAFYIPHIRGLYGSKASSSKEESTIYLGSGRNKKDLKQRIAEAQEKFDLAVKTSSETVKEMCLDFVRFLPEFNGHNLVPFNEIYKGKEYQELAKERETVEDKTKVQRKIDDLLLNFCDKTGQDNVVLVRDLLASVLAEHQERRKAVLDYAVAKTNYTRPAAWELDTMERTEKPTFWQAPERAVVDETKRNQTQWYHIVAAEKDLLVP